jgi:hypothetical protein
MLWADPTDEAPAHLRVQVARYNMLGCFAGAPPPEVCPKFARSLRFPPATSRAFYRALPPCVSYRAFLAYAPTPSPDEFVNEMPSSSAIAAVETGTTVALAQPKHSGQLEPKPSPKPPPKEKDAPRAHSSSLTRQIRRDCALIQSRNV